MAKEEQAPVGAAAGKEAAAEAFAEKPPATSKKKLLFFVILPLLLLLLAAGGGTYYFFFMQPEKPKSEAPPPPPKPAVYYNLPEFLVNLTAVRNRTSFLKLTVSLELEDTSDVARVQAVMPRIVDNVQAFLRELRTDDLRGAAALQRVRAELLTRVNFATNTTKVNDVLFLEVLLQ
jgi:flagellar FliL protein